MTHKNNRCSQLTVAWHIFQKLLAQNITSRFIKVTKLKIVLRYEIKLKDIPTAEITMMWSVRSFLQRRLILLVLLNWKNTQSTCHRRRKCQSGAFLNHKRCLTEHNHKLAESASTRKQLSFIFATGITRSNNYQQGEFDQTLIASSR